MVLRITFFSRTNYLTIVLELEICVNNEMLDWKQVLIDSHLYLL